MVQSWKARQMVPGKDTISVMAKHYGLKPSKVRDIVKEAGVQVIREDGFRGTLVMVTVDEAVIGQPKLRKTRLAGWSDGTVGIDPATTKLTKPAIMAVARWKHENDSDN